MSVVDRAVYDEAHRFVETMLQGFDCPSLDALPDLAKAAEPLEPTVIRDVEAITASQRQQLLSGFYSPAGVSYFVIEGATDALNEHPIFVLAAQLQSDLPLRYPIPHPLEAGSRLVETFGKLDGTVKIYDVKKQSEGYREQGETSDAFLLHHDGLGSAGAVEVAVLFMESAPLWGGFTYFFNVCRLALDLARSDYEAFVSLFLPEAIQITRPRGKGAIRVTSPVLYLNEADTPQSSYRVGSGEYAVELLPNVPALARAMDAIAAMTAPFGPGCMFVNFSQPGHGCFIRNGQIAHGRTSFGDSASHRRVLARKWYGRQESDMVYKHVPAIRVNERLASNYPDLFVRERLNGEWLLDPSGENVRTK